ncbi:hypothetical protein, partial [Mycobacterium avium]
KLFLFFFKQKTAYEMLRSLVGSAMRMRLPRSVARLTNAEQIAKPGLRSVSPTSWPHDGRSVGGGGY